MDSFDYVVIGGGSAGCTLAARLSEDPAISVCLLEAGGRNDELAVRMPAAVADLIKAKGKHNWGFWTEPEPNLDNRRLWWPRGKGLGGSSAINGMIYMRGHPLDYDEWRQAGLAGWGWDDVLPYFKRLERHHRQDEHHGGAGPLHISAGESRSPFHDAFERAGVEAGYTLTSDFNGETMEGFGRYDLTISNGKRWSAAAAYLGDAKRRPNLRIVTGAHVSRIRVQDGRAVGIDYTGEGGPTSVTARAEVLLCAGAVQSPQILQLSGIGDPERLRTAGVAPVHALPGVGGNLQDHLDIIMNWRTQGLATGYSLTKGLRKLGIGLQYILAGRGLGRQQLLESGAFLPSRPGLSRPDIQIHAVLALMKPHGMGSPEVDGIALHFCQLRPESRGRIDIASPDPAADPLIHANYLATPEDRRVLRESVKIGRRIVEQPAFAPYSPTENEPGRDVVGDEAIDAWVRGHAETIYHPIGTCKMGTKDDAAAVVDGELRVRGLQGLRVVDASVMPSLVSSNTNAPTIMIAERAADLIRGRSVSALAA